MSRTLVTCALLLAGIPATLVAQRPVITIAANGIIRVSQRVPINVTEGQSEHRIVLPGAIAVSLASATAGVRILEVRREMVFDQLEALRAAVGREFAFVMPSGPEQRRRLLGVEPERWAHPDGGVDLARPGRLIWPDDIMRPVDGLLVTLESDRATNGWQVEYEIGGGAWAVSYELHLGAPPRFTGNAVLATGALRLDTAVTHLVAGDLGAAARPLPSMGLVYDGQVGRGVSGMIARDQVSSVFAMQPGSSGSYIDGVPVAPTTLAGQVCLYRLPRDIVFRPGREVTSPLFAPQEVTPMRRLSTGGALPPRGGIEIDGTERTLPVMVSYDLGRDRGTAFGDLPLPAGIVSVFGVSPEGVSVLLGRSQLGHVAPGAPLQVDLGASFDVTAVRTQVTYEVDRRGERGEPTGATLGYRVNYRNAGDTAVTVTTYESRFGEWQVLESSHPQERRSSGSVAFVVTVPARGEAVLTYRLRVVW